ncbi:unnamed protein product [Cochlearia groenlandica]
MKEIPEFILIVASIGVGVLVLYIIYALTCLTAPRTSTSHGGPITSTSHGGLAGDVRKGGGGDETVVVVVVANAKQVNLV